MMYLVIFIALHLLYPPAPVLTLPASVRTHPQPDSVVPLSFLLSSSSSSSPRPSYMLPCSCVLDRARVDSSVFNRACQRLSMLVHVHVHLMVVHSCSSMLIHARTYPFALVGTSGHYLLLPELVFK